MITIRKSPNADSRTAKSNLTMKELQVSTQRHQGDVERGLTLMGSLVTNRGVYHDHTKTKNMEEYYAALTGSNIKESEWYNKHITEERHHLKSHVPDDVNLIDVMEHLVDCTMAGLARSGEIYDTDISPDVLVLACQNTVEFLKNNITVIDDEKPMDVSEQELADSEEV